MTDVKKSDVTRQNILSVGRSLVLKKGFGGVGLARILSESGVPKGSFYYYFASKEAFGKALLQDYVQDYLGRVDALINAPGKGGEKLDQFWAAWLAQVDGAGIASQCLVVKLGAEVSDLSEDMRVTLDDGAAALIERIADLLRAGAEDGSVRAFSNPTATAQMLYAKWLGAAILAKLGQKQTPLERALLETKDQLSPNQN